MGGMGNGLGMQPCRSWLGGDTGPSGCCARVMLAAWPADLLIAPCTPNTPLCSAGAPVQQQAAQLVEAATNLLSQLPVLAEILPAGGPSVLAGDSWAGRRGSITRGFVPCVVFSSCGFAAMPGMRLGSQAPHQARALAPHQHWLAHTLPHLLAPPHRDAGLEAGAAAPGQRGGGAAAAPHPAALLRAGGRPGALAGLVQQRLHPVDRGRWEALGSGRTLAVVHQAPPHPLNLMAWQAARCSLVRTCAALLKCMHTAIPQQAAPACPPPPQDLLIPSATEGPRLQRALPRAQLRVEKGRSHALLQARCISHLELARPLAAGSWCPG